MAFSIAESAAFALAPSGTIVQAHTEPPDSGELLHQPRLALMNAAKFGFAHRAVAPISRCLVNSNRPLVLLVRVEKGFSTTGRSQDVVRGFKQRPANAKRNISPSAGWTAAKPITLLVSLTATSMAFGGACLATSASHSSGGNIGRAASSPRYFHPSRTAASNTAPIACASAGSALLMVSIAGYAPAIAFSIAESAASALAPSGPPACAMSGRPPPPLPPSASEATRTRSTAL
jgi:hypothetical protein